MLAQILIPLRWMLPLHSRGYGAPVSVECTNAGNQRCLLGSINSHLDEPLSAAAWPGDPKDSPRLKVEDVRVLVNQAQRLDGVRIGIEPLALQQLFHRIAVSYARFSKDCRYASRWGRSRPAQEKRIGESSILKLRPFVSTTKPESAESVIPTIETQILAIVEEHLIPPMAKVEQDRPLDNAREPSASDQLWDIPRGLSQQRSKGGVRRLILGEQVTQATSTRRPLPPSRSLSIASA